MIAVNASSLVCTNKEAAEMFAALNG